MSSACVSNGVTYFRNVYQIRCLICHRTNAQIINVFYFICRGIYSVRANTRNMFQCVNCENIPSRNNSVRGLPNKCHSSTYSRFTHIWITYDFIMRVYKYINIHHVDMYDYELSSLSGSQAFCSHFITYGYLIVWKSIWEFSYVCVRVWGSRQTRKIPYIFYRMGLADRRLCGM